MPSDDSEEVDFLGIPQRRWPHYSMYVGLCSNCKNPYSGPKRSCVCWLCATEAVKSNWESLNATKRW